MEARIVDLLQRAGDRLLQALPGAEPPVLRPIVRPLEHAGTLMKDVLDLAIAAGVIDRDYRFDFSRFYADTEGRAVATRDELRLSFCLENLPPDVKGDTSNNSPSEAEDAENFTSCHNFAVTLLELLGGSDAAMDIELPGDIAIGASGVEVGGWVDAVAAQIRTQAEAGANLVFRVKFGIHSFTAVTRSHHVEVLQSFAGWSGFGAGMGMAAGLVFAPDRFERLMCTALGAARTKAARTQAHAACIELFGGSVREGFPAVVLQSECRPLRPQNSIMDALRDRLRRNLAVFEALSKRSSSGSSKKRRKE